MDWRRSEVGHTHVRISGDGEVSRMTSKPSQSRTAKMLEVLPKICLSFERIFMPIQCWIV